MLSMTRDGVKGVGSGDVCGGCNLLVTNKTRMFGRFWEASTPLAVVVSTVCRLWSGHRSCFFLVMLVSPRLDSTLGPV
jgi:hypothetical protein